MHMFTHTQSFCNITIKLNLNVHFSDHALYIHSDTLNIVVDLNNHLQLEIADGLN